MNYWRVKFSNSSVLKYVPLLAIVSLLLSGCAAARSGKEIFTPERELLWPTPPVKPRIRFIRAISSPSDIAIKKEKGWMGRAFDYITGGEAEEGFKITTPYGLFFDEREYLLYVADRGLKGMHRYDLRRGKADFKGGIEKDSGDINLEMPVAVILADNRIYLSDTGLKKVFILGTDGKLIGEIGGFERPGGLAYDSKNKRLYVVDVLANQLKIFDPDGNPFYTSGKRGFGDGEFNLPSNVWVDSDGNVYVTDSMNFRVQVFDDRGNHIRNIGELGDGPGTFARPRGVAVDSEGHIYVVDANFDNVQIFDREGRLLLFFGESGTDPGQFTLPSGIFIDSNDRIYISDSYNRRIQVFQYLKEERF